MLNVLNIPNSLSDELILEDGTWQYASIYDLNTNSVFWNRAAFIILSKDHATVASSALVYLLQKEAKALELWEQEWGNNTPSLHDFFNCISVWGRFTNTKGYVIPVDKFWESYNATISGIISEPSFEYMAEKIAKPYAQHLDKDDIRQAICFDNEWNEQNFFIETSADWILFNWLTMA